MRTPATHLAHVLWLASTVFIVGLWLPGCSRKVVGEDLARDARGCREASTGLVILGATKRGATRESVADEVDALEREFGRCDDGKPIDDCCRWVHELPGRVTKLGPIAMCERFRLNAKTQGCQED